ncbi:MAG: hypothetical protein F9B45_13175 [Phycisphaera sp. RhM]|nr:hypothetical protein [Phycisphaera sp. RhM]
MNDTTYAESEADGESLSPLPSEQFTFTFAQGVKRLLWTAPLLTTVMALLLGGVFAVLAACLAIGRGIPAAQLLAAVPKALSMFVVAWGLLALLCFPLTLIWCLTGRSRKIWVEGKQLHIQDACTLARNGLSHVRSDSINKLPSMSALGRDGR